MRPPFSGDHAGQIGARHAEGAVEIGIDNLEPKILGMAGNRLFGGHAGGIDQDIGRSADGVGGIGELRDDVRRPDIERSDIDLAAIGGETRPDIGDMIGLGAALPPHGLAGADGDIGTLGGQRFGDGEALACQPTRDDRAAAFEFAGHAMSFTVLMRGSIAGDRWQDRRARSCRG